MLNAFETRMVVYLAGTVVMAACSSVVSAAVEHDLAAVRLLNKVVDAYRTLPAYSDLGVIGEIPPKSDGDPSLRLACAVSFVRPNKFRLDYGIREGVLLLAEGENLLFMNRNRNER